MARLQSPGAGSGLETKRNALGTHLSVDTYEYSKTTLLYISSRLSEWCFRFFFFSPGKTALFKLVCRDILYHRYLVLFYVYVRCVCPARSFRLLLVLFVAQLLFGHLPPGITYILRVFLFFSQLNSIAFRGGFNVLTAMAPLMSDFILCPIFLVRMFWCHCLCCIIGPEPM